MSEHPKSLGEITNDTADYLHKHHPELTEEIARVRRPYIGQTLDEPRWFPLYLSLRAIFERVTGGDK